MSRQPDARSVEARQPSWAEAACQIAGGIVPLAFHTFGTLGFATTKALLVQILALVLVLGFVGREAGRLGRSDSCSTWPDALLDMYRSGARLALSGLAGVVVFQVLATGVSLDRGVSLFGSWDRQQGLMTVLAWIVLGVAAAVAGRSGVDLAARRSRLIDTWLLASLPVCVYALVQQFHLDPIDWLNQPLGVTSTLGSSTALATYLAMLAPLTLARVVAAAMAVHAESAPRTRRRGWRSRWSWLVDPRLHVAGWSALLVLQIASLVFAQVRGGVLALGAGLLVWVVGVLIRARPRIALAVGAAGVVGVVGAAAVLAASPREGVEGRDTSADQRLLIWGDAVQTLAEAGPRLLVGFGPETQVLSLERDFPLALATRFENARFDRAHNVVLDTLLTVGVLGGLASLGLLVGVVGLAVADLRATGSRRLVTAGLVGAFVANLVANQFAFDSVATGALFWMTLGLLVGPYIPVKLPASPFDEAETEGRGAESRRGRQRPARRMKDRRERAPAAPSMPIARLRVTAWLVALAVGLAAIPWLTAPFLADLYHTRALALRAGEAPASSLPEELAAVRMVPWQDIPVLALGLTYDDLASTTSAATSTLPTSFEDLYTLVPTSRAAQFAAARLAFERSVAVNPLDPYSHAHLARHLVTAAEATHDAAEQTSLLSDAVIAYDRAIALGPSRVAFYDEEGVALTRLGQPDLAIARFRQAEALTKPTAERLARIGDAEVVRGDTTAARNDYEQALALDRTSAPAEAGLAALDVAAGDLSSALEHAQRAARYQMRNWRYHRDLALIYRDLGQNDEALVEARTARRLAPAWEWDDLAALVDSVRSPSAAP
ncbi:MAG: O-antigen ligase family protein [Chloroflexi bacterium]|nr:O-antigen ligase family protein [Chloroflexota bacterium]